MPVPDMKLGNSLAAMGVGAYFFILRLRAGVWRGHVRACVAWRARRSVMGRSAHVTIVTDVQRGVDLLSLLRENV